MDIKQRKDDNKTGKMERVEAPVNGWMEKGKKYK